MSVTFKALVASVCAILIGFAIVGAYQYPKQLHLAGAASPAGSTFNTAKFAGVSIDLSSPGANGTSTSITNTDATDRYITSTDLGCQSVGSSRSANTGAGLTSLGLTLSVGTTTTAAPASFSTWAAVASSGALSTSTPAFAIASSTATTATTTNADIWHSGEFLTFFFNATNTARCTIGVKYIGS